MNVVKIFTGSKKLLALLSIIFLGGGFIADFITTLFWWSKIHPWYGYNKGKSKMLEDSSLSCWVISLIGLLAMTTFIVIHLFIKTLSQKISEGKELSSDELDAASGGNVFGMSDQLKQNLIN